MSALKDDGLPPDALTIFRHPRARRHVQRLRAWAGLGSAGLVLWMSLRAGVPLEEAWLRGLVGGIAAYIVAWGVALTVWKHLAIAEVEAARRRILDAHAAAAAAAAQPPAPPVEAES